MGAKAKETAMNQDLRDAETIFARAIEIEAPQERVAFLDQACDNNLNRRRALESSHSPKFLDVPC
jgi:hypothetical protein